MSLKQSIKLRKINCLVLALLIILTTVFSAGVFEARTLSEATAEAQESQYISSVIGGLSSVGELETLSGIEGPLEPEASEEIFESEMPSEPECTIKVEPEEGEEPLEDKELDESEAEVEELDVLDMDHLPELEEISGIKGYPEQDAALPFANEEYFIEDIKVINSIILNNGLDWSLNTPEQWPVTWVVIDSEKRVSELDVSSQDLTGELDLRNLNALQTLYCGDNRLTGLNVSGLLALEAVYCQNNLFESLNMSNLNISVFQGSGNFNLTHFNMANTPMYTIFELFDSPNIKEFIGVSGEMLSVYSTVGGDTVFSEYDPSTGIFKLSAISFSDYGFVDWHTDGGEVTYILGSDSTSDIAFAIPSGNEIGIAAQFGQLPSVNAPIFTEIMATGADLYGNYNINGTAMIPDTHAYRYRIKGEDQWITVSNTLAYKEDDIESYFGSFQADGQKLEPETTYEVQVYFENQAGGTWSEIGEFTTLSQTVWTVLITYVKSNEDGGYFVMDPNLSPTLESPSIQLEVHDGEFITITAGDFEGYAGVFYKIVGWDGNPEIIEYPIGSELLINSSMEILVYHVSTVIEISIPATVDCYAYLSNGGAVTSATYQIINNSPLPVKVTLKEYQVIEADGINFVANASANGDMHLDLLHDPDGGSGFTVSIENIPPDTEVNRVWGTLGGHTVGDTSKIGSFSISGRYVGNFPVPARRPELNFIFSFELDF